MFLKMIDGALQPYSLEQLKADHPDTSFPASMSKDAMARYGLQLAPPVVEPVPSPVMTSDRAREQRNALLAASDWTQLPDAQLETEALEAWTQYRQLLRDVTTQPGFPTNVTWPKAPAKG